MKILTDHQLELIRCDSYEKGFNAGRLMRQGTISIWFNNFCDFILEELNELEYNTWDKDRVQKLKVLINGKKEYLNIRKDKLEI